MTKDSKERVRDIMTAWHEAETHYDRDETWEEIPWLVEQLRASWKREKILDGALGMGLTAEIARANAGKVK